jgi:hypothetical protein
VDDDDEDRLCEEENKKLALKNKKCNCCKEKGHEIKDCPKDPNYKTLKSGKDMKNEFERI